LVFKLGAPVGLETEIAPLAKPYGLYAGNRFQGVAQLKDQSVPSAAVEVAYDNQDLRAQAPNDYMVTLTVKADANGVFSYAAPRAGWWGGCRPGHGRRQAAGRRPGERRRVGAVIWVKFEARQEN
jgi:cobalt/nickel transport protein